MRYDLFLGLIYLLSFVENRIFRAQVNASQAQYAIAVDYSLPFLKCDISFRAIPETKSALYACIACNEIL